MLDAEFELEAELNKLMRVLDAATWNRKSPNLG